MPKSPNTIQFSLPIEIRKRLEALGSGESVALVAKRLVLQALGDDSPKPAAALSPLESRLSKIDQHLHWCQQAILDAQQKFKEIDHDLYYGESLSFQELRESIARIEKAILQGQSPTSPPPTVSPPDAPLPRLPATQKRKPRTSEETL